MKGKEVTEEKIPLGCLQGILDSRFKQLVREVLSVVEETNQGVNKEQIKKLLWDKKDAIFRDCVNKMKEMSEEMK